MEDEILKKVKTIASGIMQEQLRRVRLPMQEIEPGLWLGSKKATQDHALMIEFGITHILSVGVESDYKPKETANHKVIRDLPDDGRSNILVHLPEAVDFIQNALKNGGKVLVHCFAG